MTTAIQNHAAANEEAARANAANEALKSEAQAEAARHNRKQERLASDQLKETQKANRANELWRQESLKLQKTQARASAVGQALGGLGGAAMLAFNDIAWYVSSAQEAEGILSLPSKDPLGTMYKIGSAWSTFGSVINSQSDYVPGAPSIMTMATIPTVGETGPKSVLNRAVDHMWMVINERNGRNSAYEPADVGIYQLSLGNHIALIKWLEKIYSWIVAYSTEDSALPRGIIEANYVDFEDVRRHRYDLHNLIQNYKAWLQPYRVLPSLTLIDRWAFAYGTVFCDDEEKDRVQWYNYMPAGFFKLDITGSDSTKLVFKPLIPMAVDVNGYDQWCPHPGYAKTYLTLLKFYDLQRYVEEMQEGYYAAQDVKIMNSDITSYVASENATKIFFNDKEWALSGTPVIAKDKWALYQFKNAYFASQTPKLTTPYIDQVRATNSDGSTYSYIASGAPGSPLGYQGSWIVDLPANKTTPDMIIECTRLLNPSALSSGTNGVFYTEIPLMVWYTKVTPVVTTSENGNLITYSTSRSEPRHFLAMASSLISNSNALNPYRELSYEFTPAVLLAGYTTAKNAFRYCPNAQLVFTEEFEDDNDGATVTAAFTSNNFTSDWETYVEVPSNRLAVANERIAYRMLGTSKNFERK